MPPTTYAGKDLVIPVLTLPKNPVPHNRVQMVMLRTTRYAFEGQAKLAHDAGVCRSTISRLLSRQAAPSLRLAQAVTDALSRTLGLPLKTSDPFSQDGTYSQPSACTLSGCRGCLREWAYDHKGYCRPQWANAKPGDWSLSPQVF